MAKAKRTLKWQRDPEGMRLRILEAAKQEFATHGLAGARVDRIAVKAGANKRMLYYHVGKKDELYLAVLEGAYEKIRTEERGLDLEHLASARGDQAPDRIHLELFPPQSGIPRAPEHRESGAAQASQALDQGQVAALALCRDDPHRGERGVESGDFQVAVDPVQLYISIAALSFFYLSNSATLSVIFGRDLLTQGQGIAPRPTWWGWCWLR